MATVKLNNCLCGTAARWRSRHGLLQPYCPNCQASGMWASHAKIPNAAEAWNINTAPLKGKR